MFEFSLFSFFFSFFPQTSRQGSLNRDVIFKMSFKKACFRLINGPTIHLRLRKGNKNTVFFNNLRGRVTRKVCLDLRFFRLREFLFFSSSFFLYIRRNVYENSNLADFHGRARIVSLWKTSPRPFICSERFQRWRHNSRELCVFKRAPVEKVAWNRQISKILNNLLYKYFQSSLYRNKYYDYILYIYKEEETSNDNGGNIGEITV